MARKPLTLITPMRTSELLELMHQGFEKSADLEETDPEEAQLLSDLATSVMSLLAIVFRHRECTLDPDMLHRVMLLKDRVGGYEQAA